MTKTMTKTLPITYERRQPGLCGGVTSHTGQAPIMERAEFERLAADNPTGPNYRVGTAAGYPSCGYWVANSTRYPDYDVLMEHIGHGCTRPVAYCLRAECED